MNEKKHILAKLISGELVIGIKDEMGVKRPYKILADQQGFAGMDIFLGLRADDKEDWIIPSSCIMCLATPNKNIVGVYETIGKKVKPVKNKIVDMKGRPAS